MVEAMRKILSINKFNKLNYNINKDFEGLKITSKVSEEYFKNQKKQRNKRNRNKWNNSRKRRKRKNNKRKNIHWEGYKFYTSKIRFL